MTEDCTQKCLQGGSFVFENYQNGDVPIEIIPTTTNNTGSLAYRTYKYRWVILTLYVLSCFVSAVQWPLYTIIANVVVEHYGVSYHAVNWTGMVFLFWYIVFVYPGTYFIEKWGLRTAVLFGSLGGCVGAWIKIASVKSNSFWVLILGQSVVAITQTLLTSIPAALAATWFGPDQVSTACSIGMFGIQLGIAIGCLVPPMIVEGTRTEQGLHTLALGSGVLSSVIFLVTLIGFREKPPTPPSRAQLTSKQESVDVTQSLKRLIINIPFMMFLLAYSFNVGTFFGICFLLNPILIAVYENAALDIGRIGMLFVVSGIIGCLMLGFILDKYRKFRQTTVFIFSISTMTMLAFSVCLNKGIAVQYAVVTILGFVNNVVLPLGLEIGAEITYPEPISVSSGMLLISAKVFGIIFVHLYSFLLSNLTGMLPHLVMSTVGLLSTALVFFMRFDLKRQNAEAVVSLE